MNNGKGRKSGTIFRVILLCCCIFSKASAQNPSSYYVEDPKLFRGGITAGANFCQIDGDKYAGYYRVGVNAGVVLYTRLNDKFFISMDLLYSQKGAASNFIKSSSSGKYNILKQSTYLHYAEIPILLNIQDHHQNHVGLGFSYSRLITASETIKTDPDAGYDADKYPFKKYDLNFVASGDLCLTKGLWATLRFQYSMLPIRKTVDYEFARSEQHNNLWVLRVTYVF
jgi:hypothetical protein